MTFSSPRASADRRAWVGLALALTLVTSVAEPARAQRPARPMVLLDLPASPRALALGDAYAAIGGDAAALFYNPGQLATTDAPSAGVSVQRYLAGSTLGALALSTPIGSVRAGFGIRSLAYGTVDRIDCDPTTACERGVATGGTVRADEVALTAGAAQRVGRLRVGVAATAASQQIADATGSAVTVDVGASGTVAGDATVAIAVQQAASRVRVGAATAPLPRTMRAGVAVPLSPHSSGTIRALALADYVQRDGLGQLRGGAELGWSARSDVALVARIGARTRHSGELGGALTGGGGLVVRHLSLDYAYDALRDLGGTHRFGIRWTR